MSMGISPLVLAAIWILLGRERAPWRGQRPDPHADAFAPASLALIFILAGAGFARGRWCVFNGAGVSAAGRQNGSKTRGQPIIVGRQSWQPLAFQMRATSRTRRHGLSTCA